MFTINIRDIVAVGKSGMKWESKEAQNAPAITSEQKAAEQAMKDIQDYKGNDKFVLARLVRSLHSANEDFAKKNTEKSTAIVATLATAIANEPDATKKQILEELQKERAEKTKSNEVAKSNIADSTQAATAAAVPATVPVVSQNNAIKPGTRASASQMVTSQADISTGGIFFAELNDADPAKKLDNRIKVLSDFDGMSGVEKNNKLFGTGNQKYIIGEMQVYNILKDTLKTPADLTALMSRFGIVEKWDDRTGATMRDAFRDNVIQRADDVASISRVVMGDRGAGAGIVSVLAGNEKAYLEHLVANAAAQKKITTAIQQDSVLGMKIVSTLLSIGVGVMTAGKFHFSAESRDIAKGDPLSIVIGSGVNFTAKIRGFEAVGQININDRETKYIKDTLKFSETLATAIKPGTSVDITKLIGLTDQDKKIIEFYNANLSSLPAGSDKALIDELSRNHLIALAKAGDGIGFKGVEAGYSLLSKSAYVGLTAQYVGSRIEAPRANGSVVSDLATNRKSASLAELGIKEMKSADGKYTYTLPTGYSDVGGALAKIGFTLENGVYTKTALAPLGFSKESIKHINGDIENIISVETQGTKRIIQAASTKEVQVSAAKLESTTVISSKGETVDNLNENNVFQTFVNDIIKYSRQGKGTAFDKMLIAISNNDMILAAAQLDAFTKVNPKFGNQIKAYIKDDFNQIKYISQLTYVSKGISNKKEVSKNEYNTARKVVISAEDRLAPDSKNTRTEAIFQSSLKHTPTQIASLPAYAGQALSVSVYATPANATHRIDKYQGSIPVGGEVVPLDMTTEARQISRIIGDHTAMIEAQRTRLNKELFAGADTVSSADYMNMLKTGTIPASLATAGLSFVAGKGPKFFEARAMILGSICANKTEGIGYPQFIRVTNVPGSPAVTRTETTPEISQMEPPTNSMSQGGYTGESIATVTEIGLGIGIAKKPTPEKKLEEPPTATVVPVTPKPTPAPVAPAPAPGSNAADSIVGSTVADKPATGIITNAPSTQTPPIAAPISNSASPVHVVVGK